MQIYSVLIKIWKLQIDLLWINKNKKYSMRPRSLYACRGAPLVLTSVSVESSNSNIAYAAQVEVVIMAAVFHVRIIKKKVFVFPGATHGKSGAAETGGDLLSHA